MWGRRQQPTFLFTFFVRGPTQKKSEYLMTQTNSVPATSFEKKHQIMKNIQSNSNVYWSTVWGFRREISLNLYDDQRNAQVFNLFIYLLLPYMFRAFY
jgi:hypothetical protein